MQTIQYRKSRIWEKKEDKYTKSPRLELGLCDTILYAGYSKKRFIQINEDLYVDAMMLVSLSSVFEFS